MATDPRDALQRLVDMAQSERLAEFCHEHGIVLLVAFGSAVDDGVKDPNDLDLAVLLNDEVDLFATVTAFIRLLQLDDLDVLDLRRAGIVARDQALQGLPLYEREPGLFARRQLAATLERMDTAWLRELDRALLAEGR